MPRIATRLAGPALVSNAAATKYTVPASRIAVIQHIHVYNPSAANVPFTMSIGADAAGTRIFDAYTIGPFQPFDHYCKYTLVAAEILQAFAGTSNILTLTINGDESVLG
jgi:hypothetical protein